MFVAHSTRSSRLFPVVLLPFFSSVLVSVCLAASCSTLGNPPREKWIPYVAFSRARKLKNVFLLFPVTIRDLNKPRDADIVALIECLQRLERETLEKFTKEWWTFAPATASLLLGSDDEEGDIDNEYVPAGNKRKWISKNRSSRDNPSRPARGRRGNGDADIAIPALRLMPNKDNNCFFNSAVALVLAAFDNQPLPPSSECTPAAAAFFAAVELARDSMFTTELLQDHVLVRLSGQTLQ